MIISITKVLTFTTLDTSQLKKRETLSSVNPLYLRINHASGYIEEKSGNKYLIFGSVDENKEVLEKYAEVWNGIKYDIKKINGGKERWLRKRWHKN